jgi:excinuclease ABC subunit C
MSVEIIKKIIAEIPRFRDQLNPGVYKFISEKDEILYIGKAKNLYNRLISYTRTDALLPRIRRMVFLATKIEIIQTKSELEALLLEHNLIKTLSPKFNILLKDDKTFPHIFISNHDFPRISKHRGQKKEIGEYFGPFAAASDVNRTIDILKKNFQLRTCSDAEFKTRKKPCLEFQIKRCSAPCCSEIDKENYQKSVKDVVGFLKGKSAEIQSELAKKMLFYSEKMEYEKAAKIRDNIKSLSSIQAKQNINLSQLNNADLVSLVEKNNKICIYISFFRSGNNYGSRPYFFEKEERENNEILKDFLPQFYLSQTPPELILLNIKIDEIDLMQDYLSNLANKKIELKTPKSGEKSRLMKDHHESAVEVLFRKINQEMKNAELLLEMKNLFNLVAIPKKIEVYDNSHTANQNAVGAVIAAGIEGFIKNGYRKFNIRFEEKNRDDTAMLKEVLRRRFKEKNSENFPDFIIIDGGITQLNAAAEIFSELKIDIKFVCMSKGENRNAGEENFHQINQDSFTLPKNHKLMFYLQRLRDEAHRFAITTHRSKRDKNMIKSQLDEIDGIGSVKKKMLLNYFGSVEKIKAAQITDLIRVEGIDKKIAQKIYDFFN